VSTQTNPASSRSSGSSGRRLPPTTEDLQRGDARPYFLWWTDLTVSDFRERLRSEDPIERSYWMGALLREANTRDVWQFVTAQQIRDNWPYLIRHLGRSREMWTWLLQLPEAAWPPAAASRPS
jgi:hypothetical protein